MSSIAQPLLERDAELAAVTAALDAACAGHGRLVVIEGPPGIGKSRLLAAARAHAAGEGLHVLHARGAEFEREFPHGVVRQLYEPALASTPTADRGRLLAGAAGLAAGLFDPASLDGEGDVSFALLHGLYWLTVNLAGSAPLLIAIDDAQWSDAPSLRFLAYLVRRLEGLPAAVALTVRPKEPGGDLLVDELAADPVALVIRPGALSEAASAELVRQLVAADAADELCAACHRLSGGNPLLLREMAATLAAEGLPADASSAARVEEVGSRGVARAVLHRLARLDPAARALARACGLMGDDVELRHASALAELTREQASLAASSLAAADILHPGAPLRFVHPVVRGAVAADLAPYEREEGHVRAAQLLQAEGAPAEAVAAHVMALSPARRPWVVEPLREAARSALAQGAADIAVAYLRRALDEPPQESDRGALVTELGMAEALVSGSGAVEHLSEAVALEPDPARRARLSLVLADAMLYVGSFDDAYATYERALADAPVGERDLRQRLEAGRRMQVMDPALHGEMVEAFRHMDERDVDRTVGGLTRLAMLAFYEARAGAPAALSVERALRALAGGVLLERDNGGGPIVLSAMLLSLADRDEGLRTLEESLAEAHRRGSLFAFAAAKVFRSHAFLVRGALQEAIGDAREAIEACAGWGIDLGRGYPAAFLAEALMDTGDLDGAEAALEAACDPAHVPDNGHWHPYMQARTRLRLLRGRPRAALDAATAARHSFEALGGRNPAFMPWRSQAARALRGLGDGSASALAEEEVQLARAWGAPRALGRALATAALVGPGSGVERLREAVALLEPSPARLELASALVELGAALRRANRRSESRDPLRRGLELATLCGAMPLAERARTELAAAGARPRSVILSGAESLTPSERRVAAMAADGLANRDIAQALFVTPKTVEVHLSSSYRKLGIARRSELATALAGGA